MDQCQQIADAACRIAEEVAKEGDALIAGSITKCASYREGKGKATVQAQIRSQLELFTKNKVDFLIAEVNVFMNLTGNTRSLHS